MQLGLNFSNTPAIRYIIAMELEDWSTQAEETLCRHACGFFLFCQGVHIFAIYAALGKSMECSKYHIMRPSSSNFTQQTT